MLIHTVSYLYVFNLTNRWSTFIIICNNWMEFVLSLLGIDDTARTMYNSDGPVLEAALTGLFIQI
jgi:hypothetical protein